jgi:Tfp pilus assembly protein PilV
MTPRRDDLDPDAGLSLIELLVSTFVAAVMLGLIATILVTTLQATAATRDRDRATGQAQAISTSLSVSVRNAAAVTVQAAAGGGSLLRARVATGASSWECRTWALVDLERWDAPGRRAGADGRFELRSFTYAPLTGTTAAPTPAVAWGVLAERVEKSTDAAGTAKPFFAQDGDRVSWNLVAAASEEPQLNDKSIAAVSGSAVARARQEGSAVRCW